MSRGAATCAAGPAVCGSRIPPLPCFRPQLPPVIHIASVEALICRPPAVPGPDPEPVRRALAGHVAALEGLDKTMPAFSRLQDVEGVHAAAKLIWNAGELQHSYAGPGLWGGRARGSRARGSRALTKASGGCHWLLRGGSRCHAVHPRAACTCACVQACLSCSQALAASSSAHLPPQRVRWRPLPHRWRGCGRSCIWSSPAARLPTMPWSRCERVCCASLLSPTRQAARSWPADGRALSCATCREGEEGADSGAVLGGFRAVQRGTEICPGSSQMPHPVLTIR
jgi:hypothetical protein